MSHTPEELEQLIGMIEAAAPVDRPGEARLALTREECLMLREAIGQLRLDAIAAGGQVQEAHELVAAREAELRITIARAKGLADMAAWLETEAAALGPAERAAPAEPYGSHPDDDCGAGVAVGRKRASAAPAEPGEISENGRAVLPTVLEQTRDAGGSKRAETSLAQSSTHPAAPAGPREPCPNASTNADGGDCDICGAKMGEPCNPVPPEKAKQRIYELTKRPEPAALPRQGAREPECSHCGGDGVVTVYDDRDYPSEKACPQCAAPTAGAEEPPRDRELPCAMCNGAGSIPVSTHGTRLPCPACYPKVYDAPGAPPPVQARPPRKKPELHETHEWVAMGTRGSAICNRCAVGNGALAACGPCTGKE